MGTREMLLIILVEPALETPLMKSFMCCQNSFLMRMDKRVLHAWLPEGLAELTQGT